MNTTISLTLNKSRGKVTARYRDCANAVFRDLNSIEDYNALVHGCATMWGVPVCEVAIVCSSTIDFPEEYTSDPDTIALCRSLRS